MMKTNEVIEAATGEKVRLVCSPSGSYREESIKVAAELKMKTVMWTV